MDDQVYMITEDRLNQLTLNVLLHTQTYIYMLKLLKEQFWHYYYSQLKNVWYPHF